MPLTSNQLSLIVIWLFALIVNFILAGIMGTFSKSQRFKNYFILVLLGTFLIFAILLYLYSIGLIPDLITKIFGVN